MLLTLLACIQESSIINKTDSCTPLVWYPDQDHDGYGSDAPIETCSLPDGYVEQGGDCNDLDPAIFPEAPETCNALDDNCNTTIDEDLEIGTWYLDEDLDGYGAAEVTGCAQPEGSIETGGDCDDTSNTVFPGATEFCNDIDDDCDTVIDNNATDALLWYWDGDGDGFGVDDPTIYACTLPSGYSAINGDCDDTDVERAESCVEAPSGSVLCANTIYTYSDPNATEPELHILSAYEPDVIGTPIQVEIKRAARMTLVLSAYVTTEWQLSIDAGATIDQILVNGYEAQTVTGAGAIPVETRTVQTTGSYFGYPCGYSLPYNGGGCDTNLMIPALEAYTGLTTASFTGCYDPSFFRLE